MITKEQKYILRIVWICLVLSAIAMFVSCKRSEPTIDGLDPNENKAVVELMKLSGNWPSKLSVRVRPDRIEVVKKENQYTGTVVVQFESTMGE